MRISVSNSQGQVCLFFSPTMPGYVCLAQKGACILVVGADRQWFVFTTEANRSRVCLDENMGHVMVLKSCLQCPLLASILAVMRPLNSTKK